MDDSRIHVMLVSGSLTGGGAERVTSTLLQHLDRARFTLTLALLRNRVGYACPPDVQMLVPPARGGERDRIPLAKAAQRRPWVVFQAVRRLRQQIDACRPDVVVSNIDQVNCVTGLALRWSRTRPAWIARIGNNPDYETRWLNVWRKRAYRAADRIVTNSHRLAGAVGDLYRLDQHRLLTIGNATDFAAIGELAARPVQDEWRSDDPLLLSVGRLIPQKRFDVLIDAVARAKRHFPLRLGICGDGPLRKALEQQIAHRRMTDSIRLLGHRENPFSWMRQAAAFLLTSDYEGLPNALIEAQGLGLPAVAARCPYGPDEIVDHGETGFLTPTDDPATVADVLERLLRNPALRARMAKAAAQRARSRFDVALIVREWEVLLTESGLAGRSRRAA